MKVIRRLLVNIKSGTGIKLKHFKYYDVICTEGEKKFFVQSVWGRIDRYKPNRVFSTEAVLKDEGTEMIVLKTFKNLLENKKEKGYGLVMDIEGFGALASEIGKTLGISDFCNKLKECDMVEEKFSTEDVTYDEVVRHKEKMDGHVKKEVYTASEVAEDLSKKEEKPKKAEKEDVEVVLSRNKGKRPYVPTDKLYYKDVGYLKVVAFGIKNNLAVLLTGETGVGKTAIIRYLAQITNNAFRRVNLNGGTTADDFIGKWIIRKGEMVWIDGILVEAMRKGYWLLVDEINSALPEIAFALHSCLDDDKMAVLTSKDGEIVKSHQDFRFFASMNPEYAGTHRLNEALIDRFPVIVKMDFPKQHDEEQIVAHYVQCKKDLVKKMVTVANKARKAYKEEKVISPFSTRRVIDWAKLCELFTPGRAFVYSVLNRISKEDVPVIKDLAAVVFTDSEFNEALTIF